MSQNVNVNLVPGNYPKEFHVSQYDVGRQLVANIVDSTGAYSIPSGATVTLVGTKPSGFGFTLSGSVGSGGVVTFSTTATVTAEYGRIPCEIRITSGDTVLGTANCMLIVEMSPHPEGTTDGDGEVIVNQITLLLEQITQQADRAVAASEAAHASETAAAASEANAATSESNAAASEATALSAKDDAVAAKTAAQASEQAAAESAAEAEATLSSYAKVSGEYDGMTVGTAKQLLSDSTTTDTEPYIYRQTAGDGDREEVEIVGGTVAWNQLCNSASVTVPNGHKYYMIKGGTASIGASTGTAITGLTSGTDIVTDLTAMFGTTIADVIYAMEQVTAGAGVAWFKKLFPKDYYPYDAGSLQSVKPSAHVTTGFNQWDISTDNIGKAILADGSLGNNDVFNTSDYIRVIPNATYYFHNVAPSANAIAFAQYDSDKNLVKTMTFSGASGTDASGSATMEGNTHFIRCARFARQNEPCINLSDPDKNGTYEPYEGHTYPLPNVELRGIPKWVNGKLSYDGDILEPSGRLTRKYGIVDLGTLNWVKYVADNLQPYFYADGVPTKRPSDWRTVTDWLLQTKYTVTFADAICSSNFSADKAISIVPSNGRLAIRDTAYTDAESFKSAMSGVYLVYELATPTTETADPYTAIQICDPDGTEEWVDERTVQIPVGNVTKYHANLKEKLEEMPAIPTAPSANGTYTLKATVSGGAVTYQWVQG